jgi:uncharacterized protein with von Willebrand factor type A (vWA) domain
VTFPFSSLPANLAAFCDGLRRDHGFRIGSGELHDAARALEVIDVADERAVRHALRPILSGSFTDAQAFDAAFVAFFHPVSISAPRDHLSSTRREPGPGADGRRDEAAAARHAPSSDADAVDDFAASSGAMTPSETAEDPAEPASFVAPSSYSPLDAESLASPELPRVDPLWREGARSLVRRVELGVARRWRPSSRGRRFDFRRTLRASLQTGGEPIAARWLRRPERSPRFVLIVDGSRSMSEHARTALQLAVALASVTTRLEVFAFSTGLERVTADVRRAAAGERRRLEGLHRAWAGGTSIGASLRDFLRRFGARLDRDTVVMIASDGLDVGDLPILRDAMRELQRRSAGVVWLNPLLETNGYEPRAGGMRTARPYVATFTSVSSAQGLLRLSRQVRVRA